MYLHASFSLINYHRDNSWNTLRFSRICAARRPTGLVRGSLSAFGRDHEVIVLIKFSLIKPNDDSYCESFEVSKPNYFVDYSKTRSNHT